MKKRNLFTGFAVATMFMIIAISCKKDNNSSTSGISATIGGKAWQSKFAAGLHTGGNTIISGYMFSGGDSTAVDLQITDSAAAHIGSPDEYGIVAYAIGDRYYSGASFDGGHNITTVTTFDQTSHKIAGTFSGVLYDEADQDSIKVDNGHFNVTYIELP